MQPSTLRCTAVHQRVPVLPVPQLPQQLQLHHTAAVARHALAARHCPRQTDVSRVCCSSTAPATGPGPAAVSPPPNASTPSNGGGSETPSTAASADNATSSSSSSSSGNANGASTSGSSGTASASDPVPVSYRKEAKLTAEQYKEIYDRLIKIFKERPRDDWKKLIVFSKQWGEHYQGVFDRIKELADQEKNLDKKMAMRSLFRAIQSVHEEVKRYNGILEKFAAAGDDEWDAIVAVYRGDLQRPFFEHMQCLLAAAKDDKEKLDGLVMMNTRLVALCTSYDSIEANPDKLQQAAEVYRDLLSSITSVEDIDKKMSELASAGKIDPAFLQISAKAYGAARDTNMTLEEAKWVSYKMYRSAKDMFDRQQPAEKRIIEYLLTIPDPQERRNQLDKAVTPGPTRFTDTHDYMWSTPQRLYLVLDSTLRAYTEMRNEARGKLGTSDASILPRKVRIMAELRDELIKRYL